jgi:hypothetical protein
LKFKNNKFKRENKGNQKDLLLKRFKKKAGNLL